MAGIVRTWDNGSPYQKKFDYVGGLSVIYEGWADPGTATSKPLWRVVKYTYDGNNNVTAIQFMNGSTQFNQIWDNRAAATTTYT